MRCRPARRNRVEGSPEEGDLLPCLQLQEISSAISPSLSLSLWKRVLLFSLPFSSCWIGVLLKSWPLKVPVGNTEKFLGAFGNYAFQIRGDAMFLPFGTRVILFSLSPLAIADRSNDYIYFLKIPGDLNF